MIERSLTRIILEDIDWTPVLALVGPRQVGKTTLVKSLQGRIAKTVHYLDLELPSDRQKLSDAESYLAGLADKCVIIDEVQLMPELFALLRALVDQKREPGRFILLGSASPHIVKQVTETLAGRIVYHELYPFSRSEVLPNTALEFHWQRGGFPGSLLAGSDRQARKWVEDFIETFVQRDLSRLGYTIPITQMQRMVSMLAHLNGELLNLSSLGKSLGITHPTVNKYLELLAGIFLVRRLPPFHVNLGKQIVKSPKLYIRDTGVLHHLLRINNYEQLRGHPSVGNSWENFVIEQIIREAPEFSEFSFYRTRSGAEVDLVITRPEGEIWGVGIKLSNAPKVSRGFYSSLDDIGAKRAFVITPGSDTYEHRGAKVISLDDFLRDVLPGK